MKREVNFGAGRRYRSPIVSATSFHVERGFAESENYDNTIPDLEEDDLGSY